MSEQRVEGVVVENFETATLAVTYKEGLPPAKSIRHVNGITLRREYIYAKRAKYIFEQGEEFIWSVQEEDRLYPLWQKEADVLYPDDGNYLVEVVDKTDGSIVDEAMDKVTFLGII